MTTLHHPLLSFWSTAADLSVIWRAAKIVLIVGMMAGAINLGDVILSGGVAVTQWAKVVVTFLVPCCVSTYSSVMAVHDRAQILDCNNQ